MRIQLDTVNKTIKVEEKVQLKELYDLLDRILPKGEWKNFSLEANVTINNWTSPIIIEKHVDPWPRPYFYCDAVSNKYLCSSNGSVDHPAGIMSTQDGIYNIEAKSNDSLS